MLEIGKTFRRGAAALVAAGCFILAAAQEIRPVVGPGASREEVINAYGWPSGQSQSGTKEILSYPQGQISLVDGRVTEVAFSPLMKWPEPKPKPPDPRAIKARPAPVEAKAPAPVDYWETDFDAAAREATARKALLLVVFTGSDWSPGSKRFHDEVEIQPEFAETVLGDFVLLRLDYPTHAAQSAGLRQQNKQLRQRLNVTVYPSMKILSPTGEELAMIDLTKLDHSRPYSGQVLAAIAECQRIQQGQKKTVHRAGAGELPPSEPIFNYWVEDILALVLLVWLLLRRWRPVGAKPKEEKTAPPPTTHGTMPTPADVAGWPREKLRDVCAAVFENENYLVKLRTAQTDADLALQRGTEGAPEALVFCQSGTVGLATAKTVRELLGTIMVEKVDAGWLVAPGGFTADARQAAREHGLVLIDGEMLLQRFAALPHPVRAKILGHKG